MLVSESLVDFKRGRSPIGRTSKDYIDIMRSKIHSDLEGPLIPIEKYVIENQGKKVVVHTTIPLDGQGRIMNKGKIRNWPMYQVQPGTYEMSEFILNGSFPSLNKKSKKPVKGRLTIILPDGDGLMSGSVRVSTKGSMTIVGTLRRLKDFITFE